MREIYRDAMEDAIVYVLSLRGLEGIRAGDCQGH